MSTVVPDALRTAVKKVGKVKKPDWGAYRLTGDLWERVSKVMVGVLNEMKGHGIGKPLAALQELAFRESVKKDALKDKDSWPLHTVALWLTDTRILAEEYAKTKSAELKKVMVKRGLLKAEKEA
jgi:hypothetical protein